MIKQQMFKKKDHKNIKEQEDEILRDLLSCPCGKIPDNLGIQPSSTCKWAWVYGDCCGDWNVEFRTEYKPLDSSECMALAIEEWNRASRAR